MYLRPPITGGGPPTFDIFGLFTGTGSAFAAGGDIGILATGPLCGTVGGGGGPARGIACGGPVLGGSDFGNVKLLVFCSMLQVAVKPGSGC